MIRGEFPAILIGTALILGACQSVQPTPKTLAPEEPGARLAPAAVPALQPGASFTFRKTDGAEITSRVVAVDGSDISWEADNGWAWTAKNFYWPVERWRGASSQGAQEVSGDPDALFPLAVGERAAYRYRGRSTADPRGWTGRGRCNVAAAERITVPAGTFDTYKVVCEQGEDLDDPYRVWTRWYAPELGHPVASLHQTRDGAINELQQLVGHRPSQLSPSAM
jgi:hypothetical protein